MSVMCIPCSEVKTYNAAADSTLPSVPKKRKHDEEETVLTTPLKKKIKKEKGATPAEVEPEGLLLKSL